MPGGRPTDYNEQILIDSWDYISRCSDTFKDNRLTVNLPSIEGLAFHLEVSRSTIYLWQKEYPEFSDMLETLLQKQVNVLLNNGLSGAYNPTIAKLVLSKHGYTEKTEVDQKTTVKDERIDDSNFTDEELRILAELQRKGRIGKEES